MFSATVVTLEQRAAFVDLLAAARGCVSLDPGAMLHEAQHPAGRSVLVRANRVVRTSAAPVARVAEAGGAHLTALATAFAERLRDAGMAITSQQSQRCVDTLQCDTPPSRRSLYYLTREILVTDPAMLETFNRVFADVFGAPAGADRYRERSAVAVAAG